MFLISNHKSKTGGSRPARRHTFVRQQKYAKVPSPCGGHLLCLVSVVLTGCGLGDPALALGGPHCSAFLQRKAKNTPEMQNIAGGEDLKGLVNYGGICSEVINSRI